MLPSWVFHGERQLDQAEGQRRYFHKFWAYATHPPSRGTVWKVFLGLATIDLTLIIVHGIALIAQFMDLIPAVPWALSTFGDDSPAERLNHLKWFAVICALAATYRHSRAPIFLSLAAIFALVLADDALRLHEVGGAALRDYWPGMPRFGLPEHQAYEIAIWMLLGGIVLPLAMVGILRTDRKWVPVAGFIGLGFLAAVLAGIGLDTAQVLYQDLAPGTVRNAVNAMGGLIECLGEALAATLTAAYAIGIWLTCGRGATKAPA